MRVVEGTLVQPRRRRRARSTDHSGIRTQWLLRWACARARFCTRNTSWTVVGILEDISQFQLDQRPASELYIYFVPPPPGLGGT